MQFIGDLFANEPTQWGLRGDPYLWRAMGAALQHVEMPTTAADLYHHLTATFCALTGADFETSETVKVNAMAHGGMSSGMISGAFWRQRGFPLLLGRFEVLAGR